MVTLSLVAFSSAANTPYQGITLPGHNTVLCPTCDGDLVTRLAGVHV
jgi:hypothetical protein